MQTDVMRLDALIRDMADSSGKLMKAARLDFYVKKLRAYCGDELFKLLEDLAEEGELPSPRQIKAQLNARLLRNRLQQGPQNMPQPTEGERARADKAAIMSMLWLHYEHAWPFESFGGQIIGKRFELQTGQSAAEALAKAAAVYSEDAVRAWMANALSSAK